MNNTARVVIVLNLALLLGYYVYSVVQKEEILENGKLVLLQLAPVDPRSLMQGDYMALRYSFETDSSLSKTDPASLPRRGYCVLETDASGVGTVKRFQEDIQPLSEQEILIAYTRPDNRILIGAESFFFEEGTGKVYEQARFGCLKTDSKGNSLLIGLYDEGKRLIIPVPDKQTGVN